jgi:DNA polymerase I-like protein with 3'-5' exonuclease and polymerase domains
MSDPQTKSAEPTPVVLEIRKLEKLETTYVRACTG